MTSLKTSYLTAFALFTVSFRYNMAFLMFIFTFVSLTHCTNDNVYLQLCKHFLVSFWKNAII